MVVVQKITSLAFSLHDGMTRDGKKRMTDHQTYYAVDEIPTPYEYFCYIFHHQTLMAGPLIFYKDYINFINGTYLVEYITTAASFQIITNVHDINFIEVVLGVSFPEGMFV